MIPIKADDKAIEFAASLLKRGRLVAFPTETVYGLGADASNSEAVKRIFEAKGRPADHPLIVHIPDISHLTHWAESVPDEALRMADKFWPGPLAIILNKKTDVSLTITGGLNTIALRVPNHPVALRLLQIFGGGIAAPSANRFCRISPTQADHVSEELGDAVDLILDGGPCEIGVESTVIDFSGSSPVLLRPGRITPQEIEAFLQTKLSYQSKSINRSPGMMEVHYSPTTVSLLCKPDELPEIALNLNNANKSIGILSYQQRIGHSASTYVITMPQQAPEYAFNLYRALRELDSLKLDIILVEQPPQSDGWWAINDRLSKATIPYQAHHSALNRP